jgi:peptidoglycan/xylan/chitin deacetylase (PgdA/CDA1 family)
MSDTAFTFNFDDGYQSWLAAADVLEDHGWRGTFNVCLRSVVHERGRRPRMFTPSKVLTWDEVVDLRDRGHEIASHGALHLDLPLATPAELDLEIRGSKAVFEAHGIEVRAYTAPYNSLFSAAHQVVRQHYQYVRGKAGTNLWPHYGQVYHAVGEAEAVARLQEGRWIVGSWHDVDLVSFAVACDEVQENGAEVLTVGQVMSRQWYEWRTPVQAMGQAV